MHTDGATAAHGTYSLLNLVEIAFVCEGVVLTAAVLSVRISWDSVVLGKTASFSFCISSFVAASSALAVCWAHLVLCPAHCCYYSSCSPEGREGKKTNETCCA